MFTSKVKLRNILLALSSAVDKAVASTKDELRPFFDAAAKFAGDGHTATADRMLEPVLKLFHEWETHNVDLLGNIDNLGRAELKKEIAYHKAMPPRLDAFVALREPFATDAGEEIAFRRNIGESYSEALCARNELSALVKQTLERIQRKEPMILATAAEAFETFNLIENYGRVHSFEALEKLHVRIKEAHRIILAATKRVRNYEDASA